MNLVSGIKYNLRGLGMGFKTPKLLMLGLIRFFTVILITIFAAGLILVYHQEILGFMWTKPENQWVTWLWYLLSWLLSAVLVGIIGGDIFSGFTNSIQRPNYGHDVPDYRKKSDGQYPGIE